LILTESTRKHQITKESQHSSQIKILVSYRIMCTPSFTSFRP